MTVLFGVIAIGVIAGVFLLAAGRIGGELPATGPDEHLLSLAEVPVGDLVPASIEEIRLDQAVRGYRMDEVDGVIDRLSAEIAQRDDLLALREAEIRDLRSGAAPSAAAPDTAGGSLA